MQLMNHTHTQTHAHICTRNRTQTRTQGDSKSEIQSESHNQSASFPSSSYSSDSVSVSVSRCPHANTVSLDVIQSRLSLPISLLACSECKGTDRLWVCLVCGHSACGTISEGHCKRHQELTDHPIIINLTTQECYCFKCRGPVLESRHGTIQLAREILLLRHPGSMPASRTRRGTLIHPSAPSHISKPVPIKKQRNGLALDSPKTHEGFVHSNPTSPGGSSYPPTLSSSQSQSQTHTFTSLQSPSASLSSSPSASPSPSPVPSISELSIPTSLGDDISVSSPPTADLTDPLLGRRGLKNLGNTCFMNSVLQVLSNIKDFRDFFLHLHVPNRPSDSPIPSEVPSSSDCLSTGFKESYVSQPTQSQSSTYADCSVLYELKKIVEELWSPGTSAIVPDLFHQSIHRIIPSFEHNIQQDAQEFLRYLLDRVQTELGQCNIHNFDQTNVTSSPSSPLAVLQRDVIHNIFGGSLISEVACQKCHRVSYVKESFLDLSLNIPPEKIMKRPQREASRGSRISCTLSECLNLFTTTEELERSEKYHCHLCHGKEEALKKFTIETLPPVLCIHIKRFCSTSSRSKIDTIVEFPLDDLDMSPYSLAKTDTTYECTGVIAHMGARANDGHYSCFVRSPTNGDWLEMNDSHVRRTDRQQVEQSPAYILFYRRRRSPSSVIVPVRKSRSRPASRNSADTAASPPQSLPTTTATVVTITAVSGLRKRKT